MCRYGRLPSLLATEAGYVEEEQVELSLLKEAYSAFCEIEDDKNKSFVSASLADYYVDRCIDEIRAAYWLLELESNLSKYSDDYLQSVYRETKIAFNS